MAKAVILLLNEGTSIGYQAYQIGTHGALGWRALHQAGAKLG